MDGAERLTNLEPMEDDAYRTSLPGGSFDLVHVRFLLAPLGRDDEPLREVLALGVPGGVLAVREPDASSWNYWPPRAGWDMLEAAILAAFRTGGGNFDAGRRAYAMRRGAGPSDVQARTHVLTLPPAHPFRRLPVHFAASLRSRILADRILSEWALEDAIADCEVAAADPETIVTTFLLAQAWGSKPSS